MTKADIIFRDLGQLYDFFGEIRKARLKDSKTSEAVEPSGGARDTRYGMQDERGTLRVAEVTAKDIPYTKT